MELIHVDVLGPSTLRDPVAQNEEKWQNNYVMKMQKGLNLLSGVCIAFRLASPYKFALYPHLEK